MASAETTSDLWPKIPAKFSVDTEIKGMVFDLPDKPAEIHTDKIFILTVQTEVDITCALEFNFPPPGHFLPQLETESPRQYFDRMKHGINTRVEFRKTVDLTAQGLNRIEVKLADGEMVWFPHSSKSPPIERAFQVKVHRVDAKDREKVTGEATTYHPDPRSVKQVLAENIVLRWD